MATFPLLKSGAITQYPLPISTGQGVQVVRFLDGSDQRFLLQGRQFRRWQIDLTQLSDEELTSLEQFFNDVSGEYSDFTFVEPIGGTSVPNCRLGSPDLQLSWNNTDSGSTSFWVVETNG